MSIAHMIIGVTQLDDFKMKNEAADFADDTEGLKKRLPIQSLSVFAGDLGGPVLFKLSLADNQFREYSLMDTGLP